MLRFVAVPKFGKKINVSNFDENAMKATNFSKVFLSVLNNFKLHCRSIFFVRLRQVFGEISINFLQQELVAHALFA
jgi:hypothetical protein